MTGESFRKRVEILVERVGSQVELARKSGLSDRAIRDYLAGTAKPKGESTQRLAQAGRVRIEWLLTGAEPMEEGGTGAPSMQQTRASYQAINLKALAAAITAVEERMPLVGPEAKAGVVAACYDHLISHDTTDREILSGFLDLIAGAVPSAYKLAEPLADDDLAVADRKRKPSTKR